jgi:hypothetical protein
METDDLMVNFDRPISAFSSRFKAITAGASDRFKTVSPNVRALTTASPKVKVIAVGAALAFVTGVSAPAFAATGHSDSSAATQNVAMASGGSGSSSKAPTDKQLHPTAIQGGQVDFKPTADQMRNAQKIIQAGQAMGLKPRAWVIAVATSMQETHLHNYSDLGGANDHDSLGLFQQRPSSGWGSPGQIENPTYASKSFYKALTQVHNWDKMPLTDAAQAVQVSAFGDRYAQWEAHAGDVVDAFYGHGPLASAAHKVM